MTGEHTESEHTATERSSAPPAPIAQREQRHRRTVLLSLAVLLVLSISPVVGHHVVRAVDWLPASLEHLGPLCMVALHHLLVPVHEGFHYVLFGGVAYAVYDRGRAAWRMQHHLAALDVTAVHSDALLVRVIGRLGFPLSRVHIVGGLPNPAFTVGWLTPHIFVAHELSQTLPEVELEAVLAHEVAHVRRRDPLRLFLLRGLANTLFWLPAIRRLVEDLSDEAEIAADDAVAPSLRLALASAILRVARGHVNIEEPAIGFHRDHMIERRIRRLAGEAPLVVSHVSRRSITAAAIALLAVWASGVMVLHPLPDTSAGAGVGAAGAHCGHTTQSAWSHLFCEGALRAEIHCSVAGTTGERTI